MYAPIEKICEYCNRFLGQINDDIDIANRLVEYLKINNYETEEY